MYRGSVSAEQNHASIYACLGNGGNFSIVEHIQCLMKRQQELMASITSKEIRHISMVDAYKSKAFSDAESTAADTLARQSLTGYAYEKKFLPEYLFSTFSTI